MTEIDDARIQIVKTLLDLSPKVRAFARGYLATYYPPRKTVEKLKKGGEETCQDS